MVVQDAGLQAWNGNPCKGRSMQRKAWWVDSWLAARSRGATERCRRRKALRTKQTSNPSLESVQVDDRIATRPLRPIVEHADDRHGKNVLDAADQVPFASHGKHRSGFQGFDDFAGKRASRNDCNIHFVILCQTREITDGAYPTSSAVFDTVCDFVSASIEL